MYFVLCQCFACLICLMQVQISLVCVNIWVEHFSFLIIWIIVTITTHLRLDFTGRLKTKTDFYLRCKLNSRCWRVQWQIMPLLIWILSIFLTWMCLTIGFKHQAKFRVTADVHSRPFRCSRWCIQELPEYYASHLCKRIDSPAHLCSLKCKEN